MPTFADLRTALAELDYEVEEITPLSSDLDEYRQPESHQAGISDTRAPAGPELEETNTAGRLRLADACRTGAARLIYASSHSVYGTLHHRTPITEDADTSRYFGPLNPYATSKLALDQQMRTRYATGLEWVGLRYTNVVGPDETGKGPMASILSQLPRQAARTGQIRVFGDSLTAARDYISSRPSPPPSSSSPIVGRCQLRSTTSAPASPSSSPTSHSGAPACTARPPVSRCLPSWCRTRSPTPTSTSPAQT
ncbi:NAD-dependent epimerase/dehydratase family protein [Streptomyces sp. NBC_00846]|uniref:NAD-dependent epimerase/dehydratase family protein n=1 Tax=Streptomyces sp. NBC_00846 TaxID=2975849 RepID=UPI003870167C|nr:NAD-dependent epimerase/dehydratase family protein [Streptomyces sp. NBC_00846]